MSNEKQTAVEWLTKKLWDEFGFAFSNNILEQAKVIEKQQIVEAFIEGYNSGENKAFGIPEKSRKQFEDGEQYYSQTYSNK